MCISKEKYFLQQKCIKTIAKGLNEFSIKYTMAYSPKHIIIHKSVRYWYIDQYRSSFYLFLPLSILLSMRATPFLLRDPDNHDGVITHLEPDILECEIKWALESITMNKASGGDGIPVKLCQILKDDAVKVLHSICQQIWKTQHWPQDWKRSVFTPIPKKGNAEECSNYSHLLAK